VGSGRLWLFFVLTFAMSWPIWIVEGALSLHIASEAGFALFLLGVFGPTLSALILTRLTSGGTGVRALVGRVKVWRVGPKWYLFVFLLFGVITAAGIALASTLGGFPLKPENLQPWYLVPILFVIIFFLGGPIQEEFGWRGYALPRLQASQSALSSALVVGVIWGIWHLPLYWLKGSGQNTYVSGSGDPVTIVQSAAVFVAATVAMSIIYAFVYNGTRGSLLLPLLLHASINTSDGWLSSMASPEATSTVLAFQAVLLWVVAVTATVLRGPKDLSSAPRQTQV